MSRADERFEAFTLAMRGGNAVDLAAVFDGLDRLERLELEDMIDGFMSSSESAPADLASFEATLQEDPYLDRLGRAVEGVSGLWPSTLPRLRGRAKLGRDEIASRLADELGNPDGSDKIKAYYHDMEWGELPAEGVNDQVIESLARILDAEPDELRQAGSFGSASRMSGDAPHRPAETAQHRSGRGLGRFAVFARMIGTNQEASASPMMSNRAPTPPAIPGTGDDGWDETDRLFRGG